MPLYEYQAYSSDGEFTKGMVDAPSENEAKAKLREQGLMVSKLGEPGRSKGAALLTGDNLVAITHQLSELLKAGLPLYEALRSLEEQYRGERYHRLLLNLCEQIKGGTPLSQAMAAYPGSFDRLYCSMVAAGEAAGALELVLQRLGTFLSKQQALRKQITTSLIYPGVLAVFALLVLGMLLGFVVPSMEGIFEGRELNSFTAFILGASQVFRDYWMAIFPTIGAVIGIVIWRLRTDAGRRWLERVGLKLPLFRTLMVQAALARFARTMETLQKGGLSLIDALRLARGVMKNHTLEAVVERAEKKVIEGSPLSKQLAQSPLIPPLVWRMLSVGEEAGNTEGIWSRIADMYEGELDKTLTRVLALAQPVILIVMGIGIGAVMLAVLLPLSDVTSLRI